MRNNVLMLLNRTLNELKALRLVSKAFAWNYSVLTQLFNNLNIVADVVWIDHFSKRSIQSIARFVKIVNFVPPLYNWHVGPKQFRRLFTDLHFDMRLRDHHEPEPNKAQRVRHSQAKVQEAWERYDTMAERNRELLQDRSSLWVLKLTKWLKALHNCHHFSFSLVDYAHLDENLNPRYPQCLQFWLGTRGRLDLALRSSDLADLAFSLALDALGRVGTRIHSISLDSPAPDGELWHGALRDDALDVSELKAIEMTPTCEGGEADGGCEEIINESIEDDIWYLMSRCVSNLESLHWVGYGHWAWGCRPVAVQVLPNLRKIFLGPCYIPSQYLYSWISGSTSLQELTLHDISILESEDHYNWKSVFDAIRDKPSSMKLDLHLWIWEIDLEVEFETRKSRDPLSDAEAHELTGMKQGTECFEAVARVLPYYLDGVVDWTWILSALFCVGEPDWGALGLLPDNA